MIVTLFICSAIHSGWLPSQCCSWSNGAAEDPAIILMFQEGSRRKGGRRKREKQSLAACFSLAFFFFFFLCTARTDAEAEAPVLWPLDAKSWLTGKDPDAGKDWRQEEKGMREDEIVGWHYRLCGHKFEQIPGDSEGREDWCAAVRGVARSQTWLRDWTKLPPQQLLLPFP